MSPEVRDWLRLHAQMIQLWILGMFVLQFFINLATVIIVSLKLKRTTAHFQWTKDLALQAKDLLEITKTYAALVAQERLETQKKVVQKSNETQHKVELATKEIKEEIRSAATEATATALSKENGT